MSSSTTANAIQLIAYQDDPLAQLAQQVIEDFKENLPDLTSAVILLSEKTASQRLRKLLLNEAIQHGTSALLMPRVFTCREWALQQLELNKNNAHKVCSAYQRELILFDVLKQFKSITGKGSSWQLTDDLFQLFDELSRNLHTLPESYDEFEAAIVEGYGIEPGIFSAPTKEATLVHTLWHAWHTQINAEQMYDSEAAYLLGLKEDINNNNNVLYIAGYHQFSNAEINWLKQLEVNDRLKLYMHGQCVPGVISQDSTVYHPDSPVTQVMQALGKSEHASATDTYPRFLNECYDNLNQNFSQRCENFSGESKHEIKSRLTTLYLDNEETHAHAIDTCVRQWILQGKNKIGIVTENRKLARRVRALLERASIPVQDYAGWALSTTRAGAVIECWLQCIEEDFPYIALLDILKSPFIFHDMEDKTVQHAAYRLEHDIVLQHNVSRNLEQYKHQVHSRAEMLEWSSEINQAVLYIIDQLQQAAVYMLPLLKGQHPALEYINQLLKSMDATGMLSALQHDAAGVRIIEMLQTLKNSAEKVDTEFTWGDFRSWIGRNLEKFVFNPEVESTPVTLMGLGQSRLQQFDALIIASAEIEHLPGKPTSSAFFNNAVRHQLGLNTTVDSLTERFHHFRRILESGQEVLITANKELNGEDIPLSPWLEVLENFYRHTFKSSLENKPLHKLIQHPGTHVITDKDALPGLVTQPSTSLPAGLVPEKYSANSYQQLVDCPYRFFAEKCLSLSPKEEIREALSKSDYGERVHQALEAFHKDVHYLPGPFNEIVNINNREQAIKLLTEISEKIFANDIRDNFAHSGLLSQWVKLIPDYIDWQIQHQQEWRVFNTECKVNIKWKDTIELVGRLDRIDLAKNNEDESLNIIDYKTGKYPGQDDIESGEAVQLPFYSLLSELEFSEKVAQVNYLEISQTVQDGTQLGGEELNSVTSKLTERLELMVSQMRQGTSLTAWGDSSACQYCNASRICRRESWDIPV